MDRSGTARAMLEVEMASRPISGTFAPADGGERRPFTGWIELTGAIESLRTATPLRRTRTRTVTDDAAIPDTKASP
ncbi:MAG TPA: hypothetical protein VG474_15585 [Solirubrobacteraceae bacterium]|nr:hypothetical protein [Solirubrobacteraceae bacterium]